MDQTMLTIDPAWISTDAHLQEFEKIYRGTSMLRAMFFGYRVPEGFPTLLSNGKPVPMVYFCSGILTLDSDRFRFRAVRRSSAFLSYQGVRDDLTIELSRNQILSVERFVPPAGLKYYRMPFTRVHTTVEGELKKFLICAGGGGPLMGKVKHRSELLFDALSKFSAP